MRKTTFLFALFIIISLFLSISIFASTGDYITSLNFSQQCSSGIGVGIAFDGTHLWYSCYSSGAGYDLHRADPNTGQVVASYSLVGGLGALSYDATRNVIWAGYGGGTGTSDSIYKISLDANKNVTGAGIEFHTGDFCGLDDGLAFDANNISNPNDDVIYYSDDCYTTTITVYNLSGTLVDSFLWAGTGSHNSGLAVGGQLLYQSGVFESITYVVDKITKVLQFNYSNAVAGDPNFHPEDMECDTNTFASQGKHVMWSKEAYGPMRAHAFEIPFGSCGVGGVPAEEPEVLNVTIDIKPGSDPNSINCKRVTGVISVAVLSDSSFDATQIDPSSVVFGSGNATEVHQTMHLEDVDADNDIDAVFHFKIGDIELTCQDTQASISGKLLDGTEWQGTDAVRMV